LMSSRIAAISSSMRRCWAARRSRVIVSAIPLSYYLNEHPSSEPAEIGGDLDHAVREAPLVVVPREDANKALVEHLGLGHVEGRAVRVVVEIDRHGRRLV